MIRGIIRTFVFIIIALKVTEYVIGALGFGNGVQTFLLVSLALTALFILLKPVLGMVSLPTRGIGFLFLSMVLVFIIFYVLIVFLKSFSIYPTTLSGLNILGFMLPSRDLTTFWSIVFSALLVSLVYTFFDWLCCKK